MSHSARRKKATKRAHPLVAKRRPADQMAWLIPAGDSLRLRTRAPGVLLFRKFCRFYVFETQLVGELDLITAVDWLMVHCSSNGLELGGGLAWLAQEVFGVSCSAFLAPGSH